jgi:hypothetical protein
VPLPRRTRRRHAWQGGWIALGRSAASSPRLIAAATRGRRTARQGGAGARLAGFAWRRFGPALFAYLMFGLGYIGYMTFIVSLLREQRVSVAR